MESGAFIEPAISQAQKIGDSVLITIPSSCGFQVIPILLFFKDVPLNVTDWSL
jgi:hypothetical protein